MPIIVFIHFCPNSCTGCHSNKPLHMSEATKAPADQLNLEEARKFP